MGGAVQQEQKSRGVTPTSAFLTLLPLLGSHPSPAPPHTPGINISNPAYLCSFPSCSHSSLHVPFL